MGDTSTPQSILNVYAYRRELPVTLVHALEDTVPI
jgi:hypothetical protein